MCVLTETVLTCTNMSVLSKNKTCKYIQCRKVCVGVSVCVCGGGESATTNFCGVICYHVDGWVGCRREHMYNSMGR